MRKHLTTLAAGLCAAAAFGLGSPAQADPLTCAGAQETLAYVCVDRFDAGATVGSTTVTVPQICTFVCFGPVSTTVPVVNAGGYVVLYHDGTCYTVGTGGVSIAPATSTDPVDCP